MRYCKEEEGLLPSCPSSSIMPLAPVEVTTFVLTPSGCQNLQSGMMKSYLNSASCRLSLSTGMDQRKQTTDEIIPSILLSALEFLSFLLVTNQSDRTQTGPVGSFYRWGWGLWTALKAAGPAGGTAAWSCGRCCPSPAGAAGSSGGDSTADRWRSPRAGVRWRSCRSRGCSSCWGWPAEQRASLWCFQSLQEKHGDVDPIQVFTFSQAEARQKLVWQV